MPSTYNLFERYGFTSPAETGETLYAPVKNGLGVSIQQGTTNQIYSFDATADYATFTTTGLTAYYDPYFGTVGVGCPKYTIDGSNPSPTIKFPSADYFQSGADTYKTAQLSIWSEYALQFRLDMQLQNDSNTQVGGVDSSSVITLVPYKWNTITVTTSTNSTKFLMTLNVMNTSSADYGKKFWIDDIQVENLRYATPPTNGVTRVAGDCSFSVPNWGADYTVTGWTIIGPQCSTAAGGTHTYFTLYKTNTSYATMRYMEGTTKVNAFKDDTDPNTDISITSTDYAPGDLVFFALVHNAGTLVAYTAKSGGAISSVSGNTEWEGFDKIYVGEDPVNTLFANAPIEQLLFWDEALTEQEVTTIFNSSAAYDFNTDKRIVFAFATPSTAGTSKALSTFATGFYRNLDRTASLEIVPLNGIAGTISSTTGFSSATHIVYGADVTKLYLNGIVASGSDLQTANIYRVLGIKTNPGVGSVAYLVKI
jgi:hypothetical protein